ncbi:MAG: hypothetical protein OXH85_03355 [Truepera sp.]|nr:hypothetical protein [Truepera sp.]
MAEVSDCTRQIEVGMPIGKRIHITGNSASGKSTLARRLADALEAPHVELDALNWLPDWVGLNETDPDEFERRIRGATRGERWVVSGSYGRFSLRIIWPRLDTVVWLDLPMSVLAWRALRRSWKRWRTGELLWGTNQEPFWPQLMIWRKHDSLLGWLITQHSRKRRDMVKRMADPRWAHIRFVRLKSSGDVEEFVASVERAGRGHG